MYKIGKIYFLFALNNYAFSGIEKIVIIYELTFLHKSSIINMFTSTHLYGKEKDCAGVWNCVTIQRDSAMTALTIIRCFRMDFGSNCERAE